MPVAPVQQVAFGSASGTSFTIAASPAAAMTVGDTMLMAIRMGGGRSLVSVTDTQGNSWTVVVATNGGTNNTVGIAYAPISKALTSSDSITATMNAGASGTFGFTVWEYSGVASVTPVDTTVGTNGSGPTLTASVTTTAYGDVVFAAASSSSAAANIANPAFVQRGAVNQQLVTCDCLVYAPSTITGTWTTSGSYNWGVAMVAMKAANPVGTIAYVQNLGTVVSVVGTTGTLTVTSNTTAGNRCVLHIQDAGYLVTGITDSRGNTWAVDVHSNSSGARIASVCSAFLTTALQAGDTITVTFGGNAAFYMVADEWAGIAQTSYVDTTVSTYNNTAVASGSASISPAVAGETIVGTIACSSSGTGWSATGILLRVPSGNRMYGVDLQSAPSGSQTSTITFPATGSFGYALVAYKPAAGIMRTSGASDTVPVTDSASARRAAIGTAHDTVPVTDATAASASRTGNASDTVPVSDAAAGASTRTSSAQDTVAVTDSTAGRSARASSAHDTVPITDTSSAAAGRTSSAQDTVPVSDATSYTFRPGRAGPPENLPVTFTLAAPVTTNTLADAAVTLSLSPGQGAQSAIADPGATNQLAAHDTEMTIDG